MTDPPAGGDDGHPDGVPVPRPERLLEVLSRSRDLGLLGRAAVEDQVRHAEAFADLLPDTGEVLDLGAGGGVPGLVLATRFPARRFVLLDAAARRCAVLRRAVEDLGLGDSVEVVHGRAELAARSPSLRGRFTTVVARSFAPPAPTAECAVGFLSGRGSTVLVSEPPADGGGGPRWPTASLAVLGLARGRLHATGNGTIQELVLQGPVEDRWPRRDGVPARKPLF